MNRACVSLDPALIDLGREAPWGFARLVFTASVSFPEHESVAKHPAPQRFRHPLIDIQISARR
jgi:hypothetical protein